MTFTLYSNRPRQRQHAAVYNTQPLTVSGTGHGDFGGLHGHGHGHGLLGRHLQRRQNNATVTSGATAEPVSINIMGPKLVTAASAGVALGSGGKLTDSAALSGGFNPTGTITFYLFAQGATPNAPAPEASTAT